MPESLSELRKRPHFSVSALKTFMQCPRKYRLQYFERARRDYYPAALALGSAWHEVLAAWLEETASDAELEALLRSRIRERLLEADVPVLFDDESETEESFIDRALRMLKKALTSFSWPKRVLGTEIAFSTEIALSVPAGRRSDLTSSAPHDQFSSSMTSQPSTG